MKIIEFFDLTKFGGVLAASVLAAAFIILIQFSWMANTRLVKMDLENTEISKELKEIHSILKEINSAVKINSEGIKSNSEAIKSNSEAIKSNSEAIKSNLEEIRKTNSALFQLLETVGKNSTMLEEVQSQLEDYAELEQRVDKNEGELDEFSEKSEFLRGQLETILSSKQE